MKIMRLRGGLGNTMFQYATFLQLKKMYPNDDVYLDTIWFQFTEHPFELDRIFSINIDELDFYKRQSKNNTLFLSMKLDKMRFWKKFGYKRWYDFELNCWKEYGTSSPLDYFEPPNLYRSFIDDLKIYPDVRQGFSIQEFEERYPDITPEELETRKSKMRKFVRDKFDCTLLRAANALLFPESRNKLLCDLKHHRKPDFIRPAPLNRLRQDGNVYYNIYGSTEDCDGIRQELLDAFRFPDFEKDKNLEIAGIIQGCNSVALQTRVKPLDYGMNQALKRNYFSKAVRYIKKRVPNCRFFLFSDDISWSRKHFRTLGLSDEDTKYYVDWNTGENGFRDMQLISLCKHQIIAHSTFAWWGGYLCQNPDKIFITPYATYPGTISF